MTRDDLADEIDRLTGRYDACPEHYEVRAVVLADFILKHLPTILAALRLAPFRALVKQWREQAAIASDAAFEAQDQEDEDRVIRLSADVEGLITGALELEYLLNVEAGA